MHSNGNDCFCYIIYKMSLYTRQNAIQINQFDFLGVFSFTKSLFLIPLRGKKRESSSIV